VERVAAIPTLPQRQKWQMPRWAWGLVAAAVFLTVLGLASPPLLVAPERMSLQAARTAVPFDFGLPTQVPDGWIMDEEVRVNDLGGGPCVEILWTHPDQANISFSACSALQDDGSPGGRLVGLDSLPEIEIGGQPAVFIRGGWDPDTHEWAWPKVTPLIWTMGDVQYTLLASGDELSEANLVTMAKSTR
jgi:hypothetical protein